MGETDGTRADLVSDLEARARWRRQRADKYPNDERETRSAAALVDAARAVAELAADDPRLMRLASFYAGASDGAVLSFLEAQNRIMSRHGYDDDAPTPEGLLAALVASADKATA
ncbi:MAG: hypothetical protein R2826_09810 [Thermoleophilia bacterium]